MENAEFFLKNASVKQFCEGVPHKGFSYVIANNLKYKFMKLTGMFKHVICNRYKPASRE